MSKKHYKNGCVYLCTFSKRAQDRYFTGYSPTCRGLLVYDARADIFVLKNAYAKVHYTNQVWAVYENGSIYYEEDFEEIVEFDSNNENHYVGYIDRNLTNSIEENWKEVPMYGEVKKATTKKTLVVNLYAGPGTGKSTAAALIFAKLKKAGIDAELVTEYAKDKTWEHCDEAFKCQLYINAKQAFRISRVCGKVDVIITDSPILLGAIYAGDVEYVKNASIGEDAKYDNRLDFYLARDPELPYNQNGRNQTLEEARAIDGKINDLLRDLNIPYWNVPVTKAEEFITDKIIDKLKEN